MALKKWLPAHLFSKFMNDYNDNLDEIEGMIATSQTTISSFSNGWTGSLTFTKYDRLNLVVLRGNLAFTGTIINVAEIANVPSGFRPISNTPITVSEAGSFAAYILGNIYTAGNIQIIGAANNFTDGRTKSINQIYMTS